MIFNWREDLNEVIPLDGDYIYKLFAEGDETIELSFDGGATYIRPNIFKFGVKGWQLRFTGCQGTRYFIVRNYATGCSVGSEKLEGNVSIDCNPTPLPIVEEPIPVPVELPVYLPVFIPTPTDVPVPIEPPVQPPVDAPTPQPIPVPVQLPVFLPTPPPPEVAAYANPSLSVGQGRLECNGNMGQLYMQLQLSEDNRTLRDLAWNSDFNKPEVASGAGYQKIYHIGWFDRNDSNTYWTAEQVRDGIDVSAYGGREITVFAIWRKQSEPYIIGVFEQQTIYIPKSLNYGIVVESGKIYHKFPSNRIWKESKVPYFEEYISSINDNRMAVLQMTTYSESVNPRYQTMGMYGKYGNSGKRMQLIGDAIFTDNLQYGSGQPHEKHPQAYNQNVPAQYGGSSQAWFNDWLPNFKAYWGSQARQKVIDIFNFIDTSADYSFVNNELFGFWEADPEFMSWVRDGYLYFIQKSGGKKIGAWLASRAKVPNSGTLGDPAYAIVNARGKSYSDLVFNSGGNWNTYLAKPDKFLTTKPLTDLSYGTNVQQVGNYQYYPDLKAGTFFALIVELMLFERHGLQSEVVPTWWHTLELSYYPNSRSFKQFNGEVYFTGIKPEVGAETEYQMASIVKFFNTKGLIDMWSDPIIWSKEGDNSSSILYPEFDVQKRTCSGDQPASFPPSAYRVPFTRLLSNINNFMDALSMPVYQQYINNSIQVADVYWNNVLRQNANKYPIGCMEDKAPFVAYRRKGNVALVFAWHYCNHKTIDVGFKIDGFDYSVRLEGCYPSIVEVELNSASIPIPQPIFVPVPQPVPVPLPVALPINPPTNSNVDTSAYVFHQGFMEGNPNLGAYYEKYRSMVKNEFLGVPEVHLEFPSNTISYHGRKDAGTIIYSTVSLYDSANRLIIQSSGAGALEGDPVWGNNHGCYYKIPEGSYRVVIENNGSTPTGVESWLLAECFRQDANSSSAYYDYGPSERIGLNYPSYTKEFTFNTAGVKEQPSGLIKVNNVSR